MVQASEIVLCEAEPSHASRRVDWGATTERILLAVLFVLFVGRALVPAWRHLGSDFANYYLVASLYRDGYPVERVYEWTWLQRQKDHAGIDRPLAGFAPLTVTSALLVRPFSSMLPSQANRVWIAISFGLLPLIAAILKRIIALPWRRIGLIMFLAVAPLHSNFLLGQVHLVMLLLLTVAAWLYLTNRPFLSGFAIAGTAFLKVYPACFLVYFLLKKQWRAAAGLLLGMAAAVVASMRLFGIDACRIYFREVLPWSLRGEIVDPYGIGWDSLNSFFRRLFIFEPELNPAPIAHLPLLYAVLHSIIFAAIVVLFLWAIGFQSAVQSRQKLEWASVCFLLLLLSPEPLPYHFVVLILVAALALDYLIIEGRLSWVKWLVAPYALACIPYDRIYRVNPRGWFALLVFPRLYWMLLLAGALLCLLLTSDGALLRNRLRSRSFAYTAAACIAISAVGFVMDLDHMNGQFDNYRARITATVGSAIAIDPVVSADGILYGALTPTFTATHDAYVIHQLKNDLTISCEGHGDWFHPAATTDGQTILAEVASADHSSIIRFEPSDCMQNRLSRITEVADGQQPVLSRDGGTLAYVRESRGHGSLFVSSLHHSHDKPAAQRQVAGPQYDVREAAFSPEGVIVFSSWQSHSYHLFAFEPERNVVSEMSSIACSARYPAFSPDGAWLAFSCERGGVWQIVTMNRRTGEQRQLTNTDCNSITPAWTLDSKSLIYATDCGRALGITALSKLRVMN